MSVEKKKNVEKKEEWKKNDDDFIVKWIPHSLKEYDVKFIDDWLVPLPRCLKKQRLVYNHSLFITRLRSRTQTHRLVYTRKASISLLIVTHSMQTAAKCTTLKKRDISQHNSLSIYRFGTQDFVLRITEIHQHIFFLLGKIRVGNSL